MSQILLRPRDAGLGVSRRESSPQVRQVRLRETIDRRIVSRSRPWRTYGGDTRRETSWPTSCDRSKICGIYLQIQFLPVLCTRPRDTSGGAHQPCPFFCDSNNTLDSSMRVDQTSLSQGTNSFCMCPRGSSGQGFCGRCKSIPPSRLEEEESAAGVNTEVPLQVDNSSQPGLKQKTQE